MNFLNLHPEAFGLDISDLSIKLVKLGKKGKHFRLVSFGETSLKPGLIKDGEIRNEKAVSEVVKKAINEAHGQKLKSKYVIASLPEEKAFLQVIQMPPLTGADLKSAVIYEAENYIPLPIQEVYLDSQIVQPLTLGHLDHQDVLIAALPKKIVDPYLSCLKMAGLKPLALEIESLAIARDLVRDEATDVPLLLIDLGATRTGFLVFSGRSLRFTSSIPVSSQNFTESIARSLNIGPDKAENLKIKYGLETRATREGGEVFDALVPPMTDLIEQIKTHIDFYRSHVSHEHLLSGGSGNRREERGVIGKILLCGGGAAMKGLADFISYELKTKIEIGDPWVNVLTGSKKSVLKLSSEESLRYVTALGLALRGARKNQDNADRSS